MVDDTIDQICCQHEDILNDVASFGGLFQHTSGARATDQQGTVALDISVNGLLALLFTDLINRSNLFKLIICEVARTDGPIPGYLRAC
jgi:hypothetical protein